VKLLRLALILALGLLIGMPAAGPAQAETPILETGQPNADFGGFEQAIVIPEPWFMWFVLGQLHDAQDVDIVSFDYKAGDLMRGIVFIPVNPDLQEFHPSLALIGPGLPPPAGPLPFEVPPGLGVITNTSSNAGTYFDIFTQINFYPRASIELTAPATGRYYMAVYGPVRGSARYALDIGVMETYAPNVIARYPVNWWEVHTAMDWSHWPAALYAALGFGAVVAFGARRRWSRVLRGALGALGVLSAGLLLLAALLQPVSWPDGLLRVLGLTLAIALTVLGVLSLIAYLGTSSRERLDASALATGRILTVEGVKLHVIDEGPPDGPPLLLLHGFASSTFTWRKIRPALMQTGFRVLTLDTQGNGASARVTEPHYATQVMARQALAVLSQLGIPKADVIGHSFGGRLALQMALLAPQSVGRIAALCPEAFANARPGVAKLVGAPLIGYPLAYFSTAPGLVKTGLAYVSAAKDWLTPETVEGYARPVGVRGHLDAQIAASCSPKDEPERSVPACYREIAQPVLLLWGSRDPIFPADHGTRLQREMPNATLQVIDGAGHVLHEEQPDAVAQHLLSWLRSASA
jgi:pimeloyl-ACP methyl ester carboxylesterase